MNYQAPHEVEDNAKLEKMIKTLKEGNSLPPIVVCNEIAYEGSHRLAAWEALEIEPEVIEITNEEVKQTMGKMGLVPCYDDINAFDDFIYYLNS